MSAGWLRSVLLWLARALDPELPQVLAGGLSHTALVPICSRKWPSCVYFCTTPTWSFESMQVPATSPVTQLSGSGFGQNGSTRKLGGLADFLGSAWVSGFKKPRPVIKASTNVPT